MHRLVIWTILLGAMSLPQFALAQQPDPEDKSATAFCNFADDMQISVRYLPAPVDKKARLPMGKVWTPGDAPMDLFTQTEVAVANVNIPVGAYRMYFIPGKDSWTMVINKNVAAGSAYDQQQDLVRAPMETGKLSQPEPHVSIYFGHLAPKQCNMRIYFGDTGAWADFMEK